MQLRHLLIAFEFRVITFRVSRRRREMYCGYVRLRVCVSVCLSAAACLQCCTDPDVTWGNGSGCPLVVNYWTDLQSMHGLRCYGNITRTLNVIEYMLVLALCLDYVYCDRLLHNEPKKSEVERCYCYFLLVRATNGIVTKCKL